MADTNETDINEARTEKVRGVVESDYERVTNAEDPWTVLGVDDDVETSKISERFEHYEQFYRAENFKRFDDNDLTRKAVEIRKLVSRAVVELHATRQAGEEGDLPDSSRVLKTIDPDSKALADIYFRDGITWMKLEDLDSAVQCFQRSMDHNPGKGVTLAYHAFARFKRDPNDSGVVEECRESFRTAAIIGSDNPEVHVLQARFALQTHNPDMAKQGIENVRSIEPAHPAIGELRRLYDELTL